MTALVVDEAGGCARRRLGEHAPGVCAEREKGEEWILPAGRDGGDHANLNLPVANTLALFPDDRAAWRQVIVHALVWAETGRGQDPHLAAGLRALRLVVPPGRCRRRDEPCESDGRHWCTRCAAEYPKTTEVVQ